jgi:hypothetical protein
VEITNSLTFRWRSTNKGSFSAHMSVFLILSVSDTIFQCFFFWNRLRITWRTAVDHSLRNTDFVTTKRIVAAAGVLAMVQWYYMVIISWIACLYLVTSWIYSSELNRPYKRFRKCVCTEQHSPSIGARSLSRRVLLAVTFGTHFLGAQTKWLWCR